MYIMCTGDAAPRFASPGKPGHLHRHKHHEDVTPEKGEGGEAVKTPVLVKDPIIVDVMTDQPPSRRMVFSSDRPQIAPLNVHHTYMRDEPNSTQEVTNEADDGNTVGMSRRRRSTGGQILDVCGTASRWVRKTHVRDQNGRRFSTAPRITTDGVRLDQWFYETTCSHVHSACTGIDASQYHSLCDQTVILVYAKVRDVHGDESWIPVRVPGGCECKLVPVHKNASVFIDLIRRHLWWWRRLW